jgi:hypothetical protein
MERISGIRFDSPPYADTAIMAIVFERVSYSPYPRAWEAAFARNATERAAKFARSRS